MAIISILATLIIGGFRSSQRRGRDAARKSDLKQIANSLEMFYNDYESYPQGGSAPGSIAACPFNPASNAGTDCVWGSTSNTGKMTDGKTIYFRELPQDSVPKSYTYYYRSLNSGKAYQLFAHLENPEDKQSCLVNVGSGEPDCLNPTLPAGFDPESCGGVCNFAITSANVTARD
jgi:type II secretory pathway pseudopilin PulG